MAAPYQAVILAAGLGSRMQEGVRELPKAILPIGPRSAADATETNFLRRQVELLRAAGVDQVVVVVGARRELVTEEIAGWNEHVDVVVNPTQDLSQSGSLHSFQFAARSEHGVLDGKHQTLLLDADIVYHRDALERLLAAPERSALLVSERYVGDGEEVLVYGKPEQPRFLGKALTPALVDDEPCLGEATGIVKFAPADHLLARETMDWLLGDPDAPAGTPRHRGYGPARRETEHEELTQRFMRYGRMRCVRFGEALPFMECDSPEEYARLRESFYPRLLELEAHTPAREESR
jgi:choline kinase